MNEEQAIAREAQRIADKVDAELLSRIVLQSKPLQPMGPLGTAMARLAAGLEARGGSLSLNGVPVRPEQRIHHRTSRLRSGIGAPPPGELRRAHPDPAKRALRVQREILSLTPRQQKKAIKAARREASAACPE